MLIPLDEALSKMTEPVTGVIHAGAHLGEEAQAYHDAGIDNVLWIEANPDLITPLREHVEPFGHRVAQRLLGPTFGERVEFNVSNNGMSSSVLELGTHREKHPEVTYVGTQTHVTTTLDNVAMDYDAEGYNFLNMDLQGFELQALKGAEQTLRHVDCIYTEINEDELYEGCVLLPELRSWLALRGFSMVHKVMCGCQERDCSDGGNRWVGWGDAIFTKNGPCVT